MCKNYSFLFVLKQIINNIFIILHVRSVIYVSVYLRDAECAHDEKTRKTIEAIHKIQSRQWQMTGGQVVGADETGERAGMRTSFKKSYCVTMTHCTNV